jgi:hypothetical protein
MTRLIVVVEGQSEEVFVRDLLAPHLVPFGVYASATIVGKLIAQRRGHRHRGGGHFQHWHRDIERLLKGDRSPELRVTTLFDLYGLPSDFPGVDTHGDDLDTERRCDVLQASLGAVFEDRRLIPYIQRHEFEALVLASLPALRGLLDAPDDLDGLEVLEREISGRCPEDINDGTQSAPSKRLQKHVPGYSKTLHGPQAASDTGLISIRTDCPRFHSWLCQLEALQGGHQ